MKDAEIERRRQVKGVAARDAGQRLRHPGCVALGFGELGQERPRRARRAGLPVRDGTLFDDRAVAGTRGGVNGTGRRSRGCSCAAARMRAWRGGSLLTRRDLQEVQPTATRPRLTQRGHQDCQCEARPFHHTLLTLPRPGACREDGPAPRSSDAVCGIALRVFSIIRRFRAPEGSPASAAPGDPGGKTLAASRGARRHSCDRMGRYGIARGKQERATRCGQGAGGVCLRSRCAVRPGGPPASAGWLWPWLVGPPASPR